MKNKIGIFILFVGISCPYVSICSADAISTMFTSTIGQIANSEQQGQQNDVIVLTDQINNRVVALKGEKIIWSWYPKKTKFGNFAGVNATNFIGLTDAKLVGDNNRYLLVSANSHGIALVDTKTFELVHANNTGGDVHSIELLEGKKIIVSIGTGEQDNLKLWSLISYSQHPLQSFDLPYGHAVVWDFFNRCLWAGGGSLLQKYKLNNNVLKLVKTYQLTKSLNCTSSNCENIFSAQILRKNIFTEGVGIHDIGLVPTQKKLAIAVNEALVLFHTDEKTPQILQRIESPDEKNETCIGTYDNDFCSCKSISYNSNGTLLYATPHTVGEREYRNQNGIRHHLTSTVKIWDSKRETLSRFHVKDLSIWFVSGNTTALFS